MTSRLTKDEYNLELARVISKRSTCLRRAVGCILVDNHSHILSTGYNGVASGLPHCNEPMNVIVNPSLLKEDGTYRVAEHWERSTIEVYSNACSGHDSPSGTNLDGCEAIHAEQNALLQCSNTQIIHTCYVTVSPCITCVKLLMNTSCKRIVFDTEYSHNEKSRELWLSIPNREWISIYRGV